MEGEGCFGYYNGSAGVSASQVQREPLERIKKLFGGVIRVPKKPGRANERPCLKWSLNGKWAAGVAMTLYPLMSTARKLQIKKLLDGFKKQMLPGKERTQCPKGHAYDRVNTGYQKGGGRYCKRCDRNRSAVQVRRSTRKEGRQRETLPGLGLLK